MSRSCLICCEDFSTQRPSCVTSCGHDDICGICFLRIRTLSRDRSCPTCKGNLEHVICLEYKGGSKTKDTNGGSRLLKWHDFEVWGDTCGSNHVLDARSGIFFTPNFLRHHVDNLWGFKCQVPKCGAVKRDVKALKTHYQAEHQMLMCNLCIENKQVFPSEQKVYTQPQYENHLRHGDGDGSEGHPRCEFCATRFYDKTSLFTHLHKDHYTCHLCEKYDEISYKYYKDYKDLENHFKRQHYFCDEPSCIEKKFVVFYSLDELNNHTRAWHPFNTLHQPKLNMQYKKTDGRGKEITSKFDAGVAGSATNGEWKVRVEERSVDPRATGATAVQRKEHHEASNVEPGLKDSGGTIIEDYPALKDDDGEGLGCGLWQERDNLKGPIGIASEEAFPTLESAIGMAAPFESGIVTAALITGKQRASSASAKIKPEVTFGGIKIKEDKKAQKKKEAYEAKMKEEEKKRKKFCDALDGSTSAMNLATGKVKADFSLSSNAKADKPRPSPAPSSVTLSKVKAKPEQKIKSLGSKGAAKRPVGAGGGWGMQAVLPARSSIAGTGLSNAWTSVGSKGPAMAPGLGGISHSTSGTVSCGSDEGRGGEKVAPSMTLGLGDFMGGGGNLGNLGNSRKAQSGTINYQRYDEAEEIANAIRAIDIISNKTSGSDGVVGPAHALELPEPELGLSETSLPDSDGYLISGMDLPPPPGLIAPPSMATTISKASNQASKRDKQKLRSGEENKAKVSQNAKVSKKTKKELQKLLYG